MSDVLQTQMTQILRKTRAEDSGYRPRVTLAEVEGEWVAISSHRPATQESWSPINRENQGVHLQGHGKNEVPAMSYYESVIDFLTAGESA